MRRELSGRIATSSGLRHDGNLGVLRKGGGVVDAESGIIVIEDEDGLAVGRDASEHGVASGCGRCRG